MVETKVFLRVAQKVEPREKLMVDPRAGWTVEL